MAVDKSGMKWTGVAHILTRGFQEAEHGDFSRELSGHRR